MNGQKIKQRVKKLLKQRDDIVRRRMINGVRFAYHGTFDWHVLGWVDRKRVIHLVDPKIVSRQVKEHELAHYRRWNTTTSRILRTVGFSPGRYIFLIVVGILILLNDSILTKIGLGCIVCFWALNIYEEWMACRIAERRMKEVKRR